MTASPNGRLPRLPAVLDREVDDKGKDAFGHQQFADALASLLTDPSNVPPFSIGLLGRWGTGKSTIKALTTKAIQDNLLINFKNKILTFNAWRYGNEDLKRAFLRDIFQQLGGDEVALDRALKESTAIPTEMRRPAWNVIRDMGDKIGTTAVTILVFFGIWWLINSQLPDSPTKATVGTSLLAAFLSAGVIGGLLKDLYSNRWLTITKTIPPKKDAEDYEVLLKDRMAAFRKENQSCERLIIFVDDLDRLSAEEMVQGLDAIRTFMEMRTPHLGVVFVISCDEAKIADALSNKRIGKDIPAAAMKSQLDARRFLDRIFQYRLEIPPIPKLDMRDFARKKFNSELLTVSKAVEAASSDADRPSVIGRVIDRLIHVDVGTPRNALQLLNAFAQTWWLAQERERIGNNSGARNALLPGTVTGRPEVLAAMCVLRVDFPDFYSQLQDDPTLISAFGQVYRRQADPAALEVHDSTKRNVQSYGRTAKDDDPTSWTVDPAHESLARFLASIDDLSWPTTLQPFLLLSQDPLSRELGDNAPAVMDNLVSNNLAGTLQALGHQSRSDALSERNTRFLLELREDLQNLDTPRRERALEVIAQLPLAAGSHTQPLSILLAQGLVVSERLRDRVGMARTVNLLDEIRREDRQGLSEVLAKDYFKERTAVTLTDARNSASLLVPALLRLRHAADLPATVATTLLAWFEEPKYLAKTEDESVAFSTMEAWYAEHEADLLPTLDATYIQHVIEGAGDSDFPPEDSAEREPIIRRLTDALRRRLASPDDRREAWSQVEQLLSLDAELAAVAWNLTEEQHDNMTLDEFSQFTTAFAGVLTRDEEGKLILNSQDADNAFLAFLEREQSKLISVESPTGIKELGLSWDNQQDAASAARLLDILVTADQSSGKESDATEGLLDDWMAMLDGALEEPIAQRILECLPDISTIQRTEAFKAMLRLLKTSQDPDSAEALKFKAYLGHIAEEALATDEGKEFSEQATSWAASMSSSPTWITSMLPTLMRLYPHAGGDGGAMLAAFNQYATNNRVTMAPFHTVMADRWPTADQGAPDYDPSVIFESAKNFMTSYPNLPGGAAVLRSMAAMNSADIAGDNNSVSDAAFRLWPHDRVGAAEVIATLKVKFNASRVITLLTNLPLGDAPQMEAITTSLANVAAMMNDEARLEATQTLLDRPTVPSGRSTDVELQLWADALADQADVTVAAVLSEDKLTESGYERLMGIMLSSPNKYRPETFTQLIDRAVSEGWNLSTLVDAGTLLEQTLGKPAELAERLLARFINEASDSRKKRIAELLKFTAPDRFVRSNKIDAQLSEGNREILAGVGHTIKRRRA